MSRLTWSQLRFRPGRTVALLAGMLVAATAFTVLTAAARGAQVRTIGAVSAHFRPAYDILVRPRGARSSLESATGTVAPDFLAGIYGGITMAPYHQIEQIPGVQVAAPIAMVGYAFMNAGFPVWLPAAGIARPGRHLYRASTTWVSANGASRIRQPPTYIYVTPGRVRSHKTGATTESLPGGKTATPCPARGTVTSPFSYAALTATWCWSKVNGQGDSGVLISPNLGGQPGFGVDWQFPMLIAAVDPAAEARLDGLNHAVTSGRYLPVKGFGMGPNAAFFRQGAEFPVLAAAGSGIGEYSVTQTQELAAPAAPPVLNMATMRKDASAPGHTVLTTTITARQAYQHLLGRMGSHLGASPTPCGCTGPPDPSATGPAATATWSRPRSPTRSRCGRWAGLTGSSMPAGQRRHSVPHAAAARDRLRCRPPAAGARRDLQPAEDRRLRSAGAGAAGAVSAGGGRAGQPREPRGAGRREPAARVPAPQAARGTATRPGVSHDRISPAS